MSISYSIGRNKNGYFTLRRTEKARYSIELNQTDGTYSVLMLCRNHWNIIESHTTRVLAIMAIRRIQGEDETNYHLAKNDQKPN